VNSQTRVANLSTGWGRVLEKEHRVPQPKQKYEGGDRWDLC